MVKVRVRPIPVHDLSRKFALIGERGEVLKTYSFPVNNYLNVIKEKLVEDLKNLIKLDTKIPEFEIEFLQMSEKSNLVNNGYDNLTHPLPKHLFKKIPKRVLKSLRKRRIKTVMDQARPIFNSFITIVNKIFRTKFKRDENFIACYVLSTEASESELQTKFLEIVESLVKLDNLGLIQGCLSMPRLVSSYDISGEGKPMWRIFFNYASDYNNYSFISKNIKFHQDF